MKRIILFCLLSLFAGLCTAQKVSPFDLDYLVELQPEKDQAIVTIKLGKGSEKISSLRLSMQPGVHKFVRGDGEITHNGQSITWLPPESGGSFVLTSKISRDRGNGSYDALMTKSWAIFRGDNLIPYITMRAKKSATSRAHLKFKLPIGWTRTATGWTRVSGDRYQIDNPERRFDRPIGWMIAGNLGNHAETLGSTRIAVASPIGQQIHRMDVLTFLHWIWPEVEHAFRHAPEKILLVGAGDPMWRGGLSGPNSLFLHADRPLVSGNGTSALLHELTHTITRIRGAKNDDWIAEGVAEFYSIEFLYRSGGLSQDRYNSTRDWLKRWSKNVKKLRGAGSSGKVTAAAVLLIQDLDNEIQKATKQEKNFDDVTQKLIKLRVVSLQQLRVAVRQVMGKESVVLQSELLSK